MFLIITLLIFSICFIIYGAPIGIVFIIYGITFVAHSYRLTKKGTIDARSKTNITRLSIGIGLFILGCLLM